MSQQIIESEIRAAAQAALDMAGVFDDSKLSQPVAALLGGIDYAQFRAAIEAACAKDQNLWARICMILPPEEACRGFMPSAQYARIQRTMFEPLFDFKLREVHARLVAKSGMKVLKGGEAA